MDHQTIDGLVEAIAPVLRQFVAEQFSSLITRIQALEARAAVAPEMGMSGKDGLGFIDALIDQEKQLCIVRSDGIITRLGCVSGADGRDGKDGIDGAPGRGIIRAHLFDGRLRVKYSDGTEEDLGEVRGEQGESGPPGESIKGERGDSGANGIGIADVIIRGDTRQLLLTDGRELDLGRVVGRDGADGAPGEKGDSGEPGDRGPAGPMGERGLAGIAGMDGSDGQPGPQGERGEKGEPGRDGVDGKDADPALIKSMVAEAVSAIPTPRDGADGKDADPAVVKAIVEEAVSAIPLPRDGRDGADADPALIKSVVAEVVASIPLPKDGKDGKDGEPGAPGRDGSDADVTKAVAELHDRLNQLREWTTGEVNDAVGRAIAENTVATKQAIAEALEVVPRSMLVDDSGDLVFIRGDGSTEKVGRVKGTDGASPVGIDRFSLDREGNLVAHMTDERSLVIGRVRGEDGKDGEPGLGFEDLRWEYDGDRTITAHMERGGQVHTQSFTLPVVLDRGIWKEGEYLRGDGVSREGAFWIAQRTTTGTPGVGPDNGWRMAVKSAKNGRSAYDIWRSLGNSGTERDFIASLKGSEGKQGPMGPPGRDR